MERIDRADVIIHKKNGILVATSGMKYEDKFGNELVDVEGKTFIIIGKPDVSGYYHVS